MPREVVASRTAELLRVLELTEAEQLATLVAEYSTGVRKKIGLATALLHTPRVLVLDEPYEAVDPVSARVLTRILRRFADSGGSVVISSQAKTPITVPGVDPRRRVVPNDANGNIALHVWVALLTTSLALLPTTGIIIGAAVSGSAVLTLLAPVVGILNGIAAAWLLGRITIEYLRHRMVDVFSPIRYARVFRDDQGPGILGWVAQSTLHGEHAAKEAKPRWPDAKLAGKLSHAVLH
jgi:hypothetical protein